MENSEYLAVKPELHDLLRSLGLDVDYTSAQGDFLTSGDGKILDLTGGFGALTLGHNNPELIAKVQEFLASGAPVFDQGSKRPLAEELAKKLNRILFPDGPDFNVIFANSGTEAIEIALKHAILEEREKEIHKKPRFLALEGSFHGKTTGALSVTGSSLPRDVFKPISWIAEVERVTPNDMRALEHAFEKRLTGVILEPILGEGGIIPLRDEFMRLARELATRKGIPLIMDEIQTGLGRTGSMLAGVPGDYVVLSKALGGGLAKISAAMISRKRYIPEFDFVHSSTFAEDGFSCAVALAALDIIQKENVPQLCGQKGMYFLVKLHALMRKFPDVIEDVRGKGLMLGVEFRLIRQPDGVLALISAAHKLGYVLAAYIYHKHKIRISPTLTAHSTLRIEPSAFITKEDMDRTVAAFEDLCSKLRRRDAYTICKFPRIRSESPDKRANYNSLLSEDEVTSLVIDDKTCVGWIGHFIDSRNLAQFDKSFKKATTEEREEFLHKFESKIAPLVFQPTIVKSKTGARVAFYPIFLPVTSRCMKYALLTEDVARMQMLVDRGVNIAERIGCSLIALGQFTSIVTDNGKSLLPGLDSERPIGITTGNAFTAGLAVESLQRTAKIKGKLTAVVGAAGNIGKGLAHALKEHGARLLLVGSKKRDSLERLMSAFPCDAVSVDIRSISEADIVVLATNTIAALVDEKMLKRNAIVCDLSVPAVFMGRYERKDLRVLPGGIARVPGSPDLKICGFPLPKGFAFGCQSEAMLLGFDNIVNHYFTGELTTDKIVALSELGKKHGFEPAGEKDYANLRSHLHELYAENGHQKWKHQPVR